MERTQNPVPDPVALQEAGEVESGWVLGWGVGCGKGSGPGQQSVGRVAGEGSDSLAMVRSTFRALRLGCLLKSLAQHGCNSPFIACLLARSTLLHVGNKGLSPLAQSLR